MKPLPPSCPSCDSYNLHLHEERSNPVWICRHCQTWVHMDGYDLISYYSMEANHNNKVYRAYFYPYPKTGEHSFALYYVVVGIYHPILKLDFLPKINATNFLDKLKTILTFG